MAVLTVCKGSLVLLVMFLLGHHRVQTLKLNNEVLSFVDTDYSVDAEHNSSHQDSSSYHSMEDDHNDYSDSDDDDHDDDDHDDDDHDDDDASSIELSFLQAESSDPDDDPDFVPSDDYLTENSSSTSSDDYESEDPDFVPSEIDLTNNSDPFSHDYESEDPDFVPSEIDLTDNSPSSSSDDYESEDPDFVPSEIDLTNNSDPFSHDYESVDPDFVPSEIDLTDNSPSSSSDDYESEDQATDQSDDDLSVEQSEDYDSEDPAFVPSEDEYSSISSTDDRLDLVPKRIRTSSRRHPAVLADQQETRGLGFIPSTQLKEHAKDKTSKRRGKQWGGSPSPQRLIEIRQADTEYFDLYLCGQFLDITDDDTNRFAVMGFNYAGRSQPFLPCQDPSSTRETVNYLYRTQTDDLNAFQQIVRDLPATWQKYMAEKGSAPRTVHLFTFNAPANAADVAQFLQLRTSEPYSSARFILGYVNQRLETENGDGNPSGLDRDFVDLLDELKRAKVDAVRVCGRCLKMAGYPVGGRRRNSMQYGMSARPWPTNSQCRTDQEENIPGAVFSKKTCNSFQKSVAKCVVRSLDRRFSRDDDATRDTFSGQGTNEALQRKLDDVTRLCIRDKRCWRRQSASIRDMYAPSVVVPDSHRRGGTKLDFGKILERCASGASKLPLDIL